MQRVNCVERPDLAKKLGAETVPSLVVVENRRVRARLERVRGCRDIEQLLEPWLGRLGWRRASAESLDDADEATPPSPAPIPEPYPPPDELDLPSPDPDPGTRARRSRRPVADGAETQVERDKTEEVARCPREA